MKKSKKLIIIIGTILTISIIVGEVLAHNNTKENKYIENLETNTEENKIIEDEEPINVILEGSEEQENETDEIKETTQIEQESFIEEKQEEKNNQNKSEIATSSVSSNNNKQTSSNSSKTTSVTTSNTNTNSGGQITPSEPIKVEEPQVTTPKQEESKPVEDKPVQTTPVRTYKINQTYINKLRNTIITEATNNLSQLNKYGITSVDQYKIIEDSSICAYNGGNRNGWTYENTTAYNTFKSSILKGTSIKIYAVDEYHNGEYIQTLCYYGH